MTTLVSNPATSTFGSIDPQTLEIVKASYGKCCIANGFFDDFYQEFVSASPIIRNKFVNTDFAKQKLLLRQGINFMIMFAGGSAVAKGTVQDLGESHSHKNLDIAPELYALWLRALLKTVKKYDANYTQETERAWNTAMTPGIELIKSRYTSA